MSRARRIRAQEWAPCDLYHAYECARDEAREALAEWRAAQVAAKRDDFAVYQAAADREDAAALTWIQACVAYDAGQLSTHGEAA